MTRREPGAVAGREPGAIRRYSTLVDAIAAAEPRLGLAHCVAVDGRAGSGKTTFAGRLAAAIRDAGLAVEVVHTDDLLAGWSDPASYWQVLEGHVLAPLAAGQPGAYHPYDWSAGRYRSTTVVVSVPDVLIVEGVGSALATTRWATLTIRVIAPAATRLARGIARDGEVLRPQWLRWMAAEEAYLAPGRHPDPDVIVDGAKNLGHDAAREYVVACSDWRTGDA